MPVVHVRAAPFDRGDAATTLRAVAAAVAAAVPCEERGVWCTFATIDVQTVGADVREGEGRIAYVDVWLRPRDDDEAGARALEAACRAAAAGLGLPVEDVWGTLRPVRPGRVFAGGALVED
ncbi:MAG TPA: hypothetical protein VE032_00500 [Actinomycetota bacterium]|nr:hypothetical protein [Actinomycetota bacterium]